MILYFSATGNCKYVAQRLASALGEQTLAITDCMAQAQYDFADDAIGIVSPTYFWGLPSIVQTFLDRAAFRTDYLYYIATYGTTPGASGQLAARTIHGRTIDAYYAVRMADTWTPIFDLSTPEKVAAFTKTTEAKIDSIIAHVQRREQNLHMTPRVPAALVRCFAQPAYTAARRTAHFRVEDSCIGCGLCARKCPVQAIGMENGRPVWVKARCALCLGCLHRCPRFAIQYGAHTKQHGQYTNPNVQI